MEEIYVKSRAKVNLNLLVLNKREDNYHNIKSVFQKISLYDEMYIKKINSNEFILQTNIEELNNSENIICKAYKKLEEKYKSITGVKVILNKKIPMQAGLAGGSTDCASFILAMNKLFDLKLSKIEIEEIGKSLGADVIPCLYNQALLAEGIGDIITEINTNFKYYIVIVKPKISCNTKEMYQRLDKESKIQQIDNTNKIIEALQNNNIEILTKNMYNVFEEVITEKNLINDIKEEFIKSGAKASLMAGSGSCVFGIFENRQIAKKAYKQLQSKYEVYIGTSYNSKRGNIL